MLNRNDFETGGISANVKELISDNQKTQTFNLLDEKEASMRSILLTVYAAMSEKGYDPVNQIVGYIISEDPTYITNHKNARSLIRKIDRDELLGALLKKYLQV